LLDLIGDMTTYRVSQEGRSIFWEVIVLVIISNNAHIDVFLIPSVFRDRVISPYNFKIVDKDITYCL
jgi:hypothetical protein